MFCISFCIEKANYCEADKPITETKVITIIIYYNNSNDNNIIINNNKNSRSMISFGFVWWLIKSFQLQLYISICIFHFN